MFLFHAKNWKKKFKNRIIHRHATSRKAFATLFSPVIGHSYLAALMENVAVSRSPIYDRGGGEKREAASLETGTGLATRAEPVRYVTPRRDFINPASISNRWPFSLTFSAHATRIKFIAIVARSRASAINRICRTLLCPRAPPLWISWRCIVGRVVG